MAKFVHLHSHTQYSLLDGLSKIPELVKRVKDLGMDALAITDHGAMYGVIEFYKACKEAGIKPIIGVETYVAKRRHIDKEAKIDSEPYHLTLLAKNYTGYLNLMKLVTIAQVSGFYYRPRVDKDLLKQYHEGLIALSACPGGEFIRGLEEGGLDRAEAVASEYQQIFGEGNYFFELQKHPYEQSAKNATNDEIRRDQENMARLQDLTWSAVRTLSIKMNIPIVGTNDFHYIYKEDAQAQDALLCVQTANLVSDINRLRMIDCPDYYVKSPEEMAADFKELPEALENTVKIAEMVDLEIPLGIARFPVYDTGGKRSSMDVLRELTFSRAQGRIEMTERVKERIEYELGVIEKKQYADYFLVVSDFMEWAHSRGIITNTRGSAAGSMVLYCLGVTNLNPLDYLLPFERFLTIYRPTLPDIDADIADDRRDEVIKYVMKKYGEDQVAHIVTFGTMMGRAAIRDVGRVLGMSYSEVDRIAKLVPPPHQGFHKSLSDAIKEVTELGDIYQNNPQVKKLLDLAIKVEGTVRHASVHAAGIVIAPDDINKFTPLQREANGDKLVSQYDMFAVEDAGLVKMDLLGIRNLSILGKAVEFVKAERGIEIDLNKIPLDDPNAFKLLAKGDTMGIFQLSSSGMTRYLVDLKPSSVADIAAMVALYRPGPLGVIPEYIQRKHNPKLIKYLDPRMKDYMEQSLGLLVYQEDVLYTAINIAGYSWEEADKFRKAMGKKIPSEMAKQKGHFVEGCIKNGMRREKAEELFGLIAPFAAYGFNKAHAASYAMIAYQTAYMKGNYPVEFMAALLSAESGNTEKIAEAIEECKRLGIVVLPPDVNTSRVGFTVQDLSGLSKEELDRSIGAKYDITGMQSGILFGLSAIKNVGEGAIESIIEGRNEGQYQSLFDLCCKVDTRLVNRKTLESLIKAGALDKFGLRSAQLLILDQCLEESHKLNKNKLSGQGFLFDMQDEVSLSAIVVPDVDELPLDQLLIFEKDLLGFYLHEPPFLAKLNRIHNHISLKTSELTDEHIGQKLILGGVITEVKKVITKKNSQEMAFIRISDGVSEVESVVFPKTYDEAKSYLLKDEVVLSIGRVDKREDVLSFVVEKIVRFEDGEIDDSFAVINRRSVEIYVSSGGTNVEVLKSVNRTLRSYPGGVSVSLILPNGANDLRRMDLPFSIDPTPALEEQISKILGDGSFKRI